MLLLSGVRLAAAEPATTPEAVDYNRHVRQILSNHCYACHGPDEAQRQAGLRLDQKEPALAELDSGSRAIVPGASGKSELVARVTADDESLLMPPPDVGERLSDEEVAILRKWIDQGAEWDEHWAYQPIERPGVPPVFGAEWPKTQIDHFILARLERDGLQPEPEADKTTLIRRLSFDLTGLPPTPKQIDALLADESADAYERLVDRLLASPRYGERMAQKWLDLARYADTNGYHIDNHRSMWLYRDWVIDAFNRNKPFDQFVVEQMAGDLLPGATLKQKIASGFHRNVMVNFEGGADPAEYLSKYIVDRVTTTATVFLGTTLACTECHDHKYDPFTQREFYQLYAYFHNVPEQGLDGRQTNPKPSLRVPTEKQTEQLDALATQAEAVKKEIAQALAKHGENVPSEPVAPQQAPREFFWVDDALPEGAAVAEKDKSSWPLVASPHPVLNGERSIELKTSELGQHVFTGARRPLLIGEGDTLVAHVWIDPADPPQEIMLQFNDGASWEHRAFWGGDEIEWGSAGSPSRLAMGVLPPVGRWLRLEVPAQAVGLEPGTVVDGWACTQFGGRAFWDKLGIVSRMPQGPDLSTNQAAWELAERGRAKPAVPSAVAEALKVAADKRSDEQTRTVRDHFVRRYYAKTRAVFAPLEAKLAELEDERAKVRDSFPETMVMQEMEQPRDTFVLVRGDFRTFGEKVEPGVPAILPPLPADAPPNRLGLARWLVDPSNPLVARVTVNRYWQQYFGTGLVKTSEDFGSQGERPSHPELLDWLAATFIDSGWNIKALQKQIVMSATYRQASHVDPEKLTRDPENRLLARGPRFRLDAELIRDAALAAGGLLDPRIGGPSVSPYQPPGLWEQVGFGGEFSSQKYEQSHGADLYRRGIYVYVKRAMPYPPLVTFDAPNREVCTDRRECTNTPLQALVLLNDPGFVEAARGLAQRMMTEGGDTPEDRIALGFRLCTARTPTPQEMRVLLRIYERQRARFQGDAESAKKLTSIGESPVPEGLDTAELAAWTAIGNLLLNLDETITKG